MSFGLQKFCHHFIFCGNLLRTVFLGLAFAKYFKVRIDWDSQEKLYLHQDCKSLTYSMTGKSKTDNSIYSTDCSEVRLITKLKVVLPAEKHLVM